VEIRAEEGGLNFHNGQGYSEDKTGQKWRQKISGLHVLAFPFAIGRSRAESQSGKAATKARTPDGAWPTPDLAEECLAGEYRKETWPAVCVLFA
jgi:hypothetical protein